MIKRVSSASVGFSHLLHAIFFDHVQEVSVKGTVGSVWLQLLTGPVSAWKIEVTSCYDDCILRCCDMPKGLVKHV